MDVRHSKLHNIPISAMRKYTTYGYYALVIFPMFAFSEIGILWFLTMGEPKSYSEHTIYDLLSVIFWSFLAQWLGIFSLVVTIALRTTHFWIRVVGEFSEMPKFVKRLFSGTETKERVGMERICACGQNHGWDLERYEIHERAFKTTGRDMKNRNATVPRTAPRKRTPPTNRPSTALLYISVVLGSIGVSILLYFIGSITLFVVGGVLVLNNQVSASNVYLSYYVLGLFVVFVMGPMLGTILIAKIKNLYRDIVVGVIALVAVLYVAIGFVTNHIAFWA